MGADTAAVRALGLTKRFGRRAAVDGIDLEVPTGAVYGFLGPNGSGKTTTIRMLLGLVRPTSGSVEVLGGAIPDPSGEVLPRVGALVEGPGFHPYLTGTANLRRLDDADASADGATSTRRIGEALERVGLGAAAGKKYRHYSLGMKQRLAIAAALLAPRDLLVLDEPTNGLDPQGTREVRTLVSGLAQQGVTVLVSSHLLSEVEQVCTHLGIMNAGRLVAQGPVHELQASQSAEVVVTTSQPAAAAEVLRRRGVTAVRSGDGRARGIPAGSDAGPELVRALVAAEVPVAGFSLSAPSLEDLFVQLTGEGFDVNE